jgi:formylglycine-generating enzyme required for sulfatase activity
MDPDPGIHSAAEWVLRRWNQQRKLNWLDARSATGKLRGDNRWYVNGQEQTMVLIPGPVESVMGSPGGKEGRDWNETLHRRRIGRSFAISTKEVTLEQFRRFRPQFGHDQMHRSPEPDCPVLGVTWYEAAEYCNWLSGVEGLEDELCYLPNQLGDFADGMKPAPDFLNRRGYRLPTEAEWEYACRSGTVTRGYYGRAEAWVSRYAWFRDNANNRSWPVGSLKPNDLGLFDTLGNVYEWCQDLHHDYAPGTVVEDLGETDEVKSRVGRVLRGGSFYYQPGEVESKLNVWYGPESQHLLNGFRVARTHR